VVINLCWLRGLPMLVLGPLIISLRGDRDLTAVELVGSYRGRGIVDSKTIVRRQR
jgi:hypothetical protein